MLRIFTILLIDTNRFRLQPTYGRGNIRKFVENTSEMKKISGRQMEMMLKVTSAFFHLPELG
jgi:hypothetical protein